MWMDGVIGRQKKKEYDPSLGEYVLAGMVVIASLLLIVGGIVIIVNPPTSPDDAFYESTGYRISPTVYSDVIASLENDSQVQAKLTQNGLDYSCTITRGANGYSVADEGYIVSGCVALNQKSGE